MIAKVNGVLKGNEMGTHGEINDIKHTGRMGHQQSIYYKNAREITQTP